ncbi:MAG: hypothetical protein GC193_06950 [Cryomorphaceae bacterium]|nr:hypothetical protein [Cryomorphaceae bacterium]
MIFRTFLLLSIMFTVASASGQCQWYTVTLEDTDLAFEVSWELIDANGVTWLSGGAPCNCTL